MYPIITISREFGSGGHSVGQKVAEEWRHEKSLERTKKYRPDLYEEYERSQKNE